MVLPVRYDAQDLQLCSGRVLRTAAKLTAAKGVGIEVDVKAAAKAQQAVVNGKQCHDVYCCSWQAPFI